MGVKGKKENKRNNQREKIIIDIILDLARTEAAIFRKQPGLEVAFLLVLLECLSAWSSWSAL